MRAVVVREFGGPEHLQVAEVPEPGPGSGDLLVEVEATDVLFLDTQLRAGWGREYFRLDLPYVPGVHVAGSVLDVGHDVDPAWVGARVVASTSAMGEHRGGGYAERAVTPASTAHRIPDGVTPAHALAAGDGMMAISRIERAGLASGDTAVVTAASGSIGTWLVPLLARAGIRVVAAAHGPAKLSLARERGADLVVDYADPGWADGLPRGVDAVFDGAGGDLGSAAYRSLRDGGTFLSYGSAAGDFPEVAADAAARGITVVGIHDPSFTADHARRATDEALRLLADGVVGPVVGQELPLERAAEAHAAMAERRVLGKTVLTTRTEGKLA